MTIAFYFRLAGLAIFACLLLPPAAQAQLPAWQMAQAVGAVTSSSAGCVVNAMAVDTSGNVYLAGAFNGTVTFGNATLTSGSFAFGYNGFVAKWNPSAGFVWAHQIYGTTQGNSVTALAVNGTSVYVAGSFPSDSVGFDAITLTNAHQSLHTPVFADVFVAKLTDAGTTSTWTWAQQAGGDVIDDATALTVQDNTVYVAGTFNSLAMHFGAITLNNIGNGASDAFVAKLTDAGATGAWTWVQQIGSSGSDDATALAVRDSSVYVAGSFTGATTRFGTTTLTNTFTGATTSDLYVAKLTDAGTTSTWTWAQQAGGLSSDRAAALAVSDSSVYVAGSFYGFTAGFGATTLTNNFAAGATSDLYVAKLTDAGATSNWTWAQAGGDIQNDGATALAVRHGVVYVSGYYFSDLLRLGGILLGHLGNGTTDVFIARLTDAGSTGFWTWAQRAGGYEDEYAHTLALNANNVYVAGSFESNPFTFDNLPPLNNSGTSTGFFATLTDPALGTADEVGTPAFTLAPNPTRATAYLTGAAPGTRFTLLDALGRTVLTATATPDGTATFDVRALPAGLYLVRAEGKAGARRLVVE